MIERLATITSDEEAAFKRELRLILADKPRHVPVNEERRRLHAMVDNLHSLAVHMMHGDEKAVALARRLLG